MLVDSGRATFLRERNDSVGGKVPGWGALEWAEGMAVVGEPLLDTELFLRVFSFYGHRDIYRSVVFTHARTNSELNKRIPFRKSLKYMRWRCSARLRHRMNTSTTKHHTLTSIP